jgi:8-oxo-dGTP pyrophosphatase MutT (NUDIX family)
MKRRRKVRSASRSAHRAIVVIQPQRPVAGLRILQRLPASGPGFLVLERYRARNLYRDRGASRPYRFEVLHRRGVDAVAILPFYFEGRRGRLMVVCKVGFRPGLYVRSRLRLPVRDRRRYTSVIEAVAGSIEPGDRGESGITSRARKELLEETGLRPLPRRALRLGAGFFPSHGQSTEKIHLRAFEIDPRSARRPEGDGSVNEEDAGTIAIAAPRILVMCRAGLIEDPKLEVGVARLLRSLSGEPARQSRSSVRRRTGGAHF